MPEIIELTLKRREKTRYTNKSLYLPVKLLNLFQDTAKHYGTGVSEVALTLINESLERHKTRRATISDGTTADHAVTYPVVSE